MEPHILRMLNPDTEITVAAKDIVDAFDTGLSSGLALALKVCGVDTSDTEIQDRISDVLWAQARSSEDSRQADFIRASTAFYTHGEDLADAAKAKLN